MLIKQRATPNATSHELASNPLKRLAFDNPYTTQNVPVSVSYAKDMKSS